MIKEVIKDKRIGKIAKLLVEYSCKIKKNDEVIISADTAARPLVLELMKQILLKGAYPKVKWQVEGQAFTYYKYASMHQLDHFPSLELQEIKKTDVMITIGATENKKELADITPQKILERQKITKKIFEERLKKRWVYFIYPTEEYARDAGMSLAEFKNFVFSASLVDWKKIKKKAEKIRNMINRGSKVRILSKDTDLRFSIKGRKAVIGDGSYNMPDGEIFTSPCENTVEGHIKFDFPREVFGKKVSDIFLKFKKGRIIEVKASKNVDKLKALIKTDKGSCKFGEFAFGLNPKINKYTKELLFDEKMNKTIHFALGNAYPECNGKNNSAVHLDIVKDMSKGRVFIDSKLVYENGSFKI